MMVLHNGGLRSLVATALALADDPTPKLTLLHIDDGRDARVTRLTKVRQQASAYEITRITELSVPHLFGHGYGRAPDGGPIGSLSRPQLLLAALTEAIHQQAGVVIWPITANATTKDVAYITEQAMLCEHLAQIEHEAVPRIDTPLAEMNDQQVIELGAQLGVDWRLTWTCARPGDTPCRACAGCRRRQQAFEKAGVVDTLLEQLAGAR